MSGFHNTRTFLKYQDMSDVQFHRQGERQTQDEKIVFQEAAKCCNNTASEADE
jgi:hypothetical protein